MLNDKQVAPPSLSEITAAAISGTLPGAPYMRDQIVPDSIHVAEVSKESLTRLFDRIDLPLSRECIEELFRAVSRKSSALQTALLFEEQTPGALTRIRDRQIHTFGNGQYRIERAIDLCPLSSQFHFLVLSLQSSPEKDKLPSLTVSINHEQMGLDYFKVAWEAARDVAQILDIPTPPNTFPITLLPGENNLVGTPTLKADSTNGSTMSFVRRQDLDEENLPFAEPTPSQLNSRRSYGVLIVNTSTDAAIDLAMHLGEPLAHANLRQESLVEKACQTVRNGGALDYEMWELRHISPVYTLSVDHYVELGSAQSEESGTIPERSEEMPAITIRRGTAGVDAITLELFLDTPLEESEIDGEQLAADSEEPAVTLFARLSWGDEITTEEGWDMVVPVVQAHYDPHFNPAEIPTDGHDDDIVYIFGPIEIHMTPLIDRFIQS